jgi:hydroxylamine oxidation protein HaoB
MSNSLSLLAAISALRPPPLPYELYISQASQGTLTEFPELKLEAGKLESLELNTPGSKNPLATAVVMRDREGRLVPLSWSNGVTEPVLFLDVIPAEASKVLAAIRQHVSSEAIILSWWDFSRRIRTIAQRRAPLDDPLARGLLIPAAWSPVGNLVFETQSALWGSGVPAGDATTFARFIEMRATSSYRGGPPPRIPAHRFCAPVLQRESTRPAKFPALNSACA